MLIDKQELLLKIQRMEKMTYDNAKLSDETKKATINILYWFEARVLEQKGISLKQVRGEAYMHGAFAGMAFAALVIAIIEKISF